MIIAFVIIIIGLLLLLDFSFKRKAFGSASKIPGPVIVPIIGTTLVFQQRNDKNILDFLITLATKYGLISRLWVFNQLFVFIREPKLVEAVLSSPKHTTKNFFYDVLTDGAGNGLITSSGSKWASRRKIITPTFHFKILEQFVEVFDIQSSILVKQLEKHLDGKVFDVYSYISFTTLDIICETAMGIRVNAQTKADDEFVLALIDVSKVVMERLSNAWYHVAPIYHLFASDLKHRHTRGLSVIKTFTEKVIEERRKLFKAEATLNRDDYEDDIGAKKKLALLDVLLQATVNGDPLSNAEIQEEVNTFIPAGQHSIAAAVAFTMFLLSRHPEIQSRVYQEISDVLGNDKYSEITYRDLQNLKYLDCVLKESLRIFPAVPVIARLITEDSQIGGYYFPAGTNIVIPIVAMLKDPKIFPEPETFNPERHFTESICENISPYSFIPFSAGPRNCIGQKFAMLEMKCIVSKLLRHFEVLALGSEPIIAMNIVLQPTNGVNIGLKAR